MFQFLMGGRVDRITPQEVMDAQKTGDIVVIDVRDHGEVTMTGKAKGAKHIPTVLLASRANPAHPERDPDLSPEKTIALYCASGARSHSAGQILQRLGYTDVRNMGGLHDWARAGGEIERI